MAKLKSIWCCTHCGQSHHKWSGQCSTCSQWNTLSEELEEKGPERYEGRKNDTSRPLRLREVSAEPTPRITTTIHEFDRLIGGGIVPGGYTLVGGDPGIGKSTLMLQLASSLAKQGLLVLYVCGEESVEQTSMRARRLGIDSDNLLLLCETNFAVIARHIDELRPDILVIDSIQIMYKSEIPSSPGSVTQVREIATEFMHLAKGKRIATFLIGHVTKSGEIAGPRVLEHLVDTVLYFEGDRQHNYRMIRVVKNRFGPTDEVAVFQMLPQGLVEVPNPSQLFLEQRMKGSIGSVIIPTLEGTRTILIEAQALVTDTVFATPSRRCTGLDQNRLALLLAVVEKRVGYALHGCDVFVAIAGGLRVVEPAVDLGILLAVASSYRNRLFDTDTVVIGEVGLGGEIRTVTRIESRLKEAAAMGFQRCLLPKSNLKNLHTPPGSKIALHGVEVVEEAIDVLFA